MLCEWVYVGAGCVREGWLRATGLCHCVSFYIMSLCLACPCVAESACADCVLACACWPQGAHLNVDVFLWTYSCVPSSAMLMNPSKIASLPAQVVKASVQQETARPTSQCAESKKGTRGRERTYRTCA